MFGVNKFNIFIPVMRFFCFVCVMHIFSGMAPSLVSFVSKYVVSIPSGASLFFHANSIDSLWSLFSSLIIIVMLNS